LSTSFVIPSCKKINVKGLGHFVLDSQVNLIEAIIFSDIDPFAKKTLNMKRDPVLGCLQRIRFEVLSTTEFSLCDA